MNNSDMPAMPITGVNDQLYHLQDGHTDSNYLSQESQSFSIGLTKREHFAAMAMQGLLTVKLSDDWEPSYAAEFAIEYADALLAALEK